MSQWVLLAPVVPWTLWLLTCWRLYGDAVHGSCAGFQRLALWGWGGAGGAPAGSRGRSTHRWCRRGRRPLTLRQGPDQPMHQIARCVQTGVLPGSDFREMPAALT